MWRAHVDSRVFCPGVEQEGHQLGNGDAVIPEVWGKREGLCGVSNAHIVNLLTKKRIWDESIVNSWASNAMVLAYASCVSLCLEQVTPTFNSVRALRHKESPPRAAAILQTKP